MRVLEFLGSSASLVGAVAVLAAAGDPTAAPGASACVEVVEHHAASDCGSAGGQAITVRNRCEQVIDAKVCLEKADHGWVCDTYTGVKTGEGRTLTACDATHESWLWARPANGSEAAPDPHR